jgi:uncharacterized protein (TIGR03083 family)
VDALAGTWRIWGTLGQSLTDAEWTAPSRCSGWDVAALYAHHSAYPVVLSGPPAPPAEWPPGDPLTAPELLRRYNGPGGLAHTAAPANAERAVQEAGRHDHGVLVERFIVTAPAAADMLRAADPYLVVPWTGAETGLRLAEALRIVVMEATVHLLDVQRALGREPEVPGLALQCTAALLAEVAPPVELIEAATGRSATSPLPVLR